MRTMKTEGPTRAIPFGAAAAGFPLILRGDQGVGLQGNCSRILSARRRRRSGRCWIKSSCRFCRSCPSPTARASKKTQHSNRKTLNTELRNKSIDITVRCELLGHAQEGVYAKDYTDRPGTTREKCASIQSRMFSAPVPIRPDPPVAAARSNTPMAVKNEPHLAPGDGRLGVGAVCASARSRSSPSPNVSYIVAARSGPRPCSGRYCEPTAVLHQPNGRLLNVGRARLSTV